MSISAVVLTKNESENIKRCLLSLVFCDEIIIIDDYSTDNIFKIIKEFKGFRTIRIYQRRLNGDFAAQRNFGMAKAKGDWILFIDADEEVTEEMRDEIYQRLKNEASKGRKLSHNGDCITDADVYYIKRRDFWLGRELKWGEVRKARDRGIIRLVRRNSGRWLGKVHEEFRVKSRKLVNTKEVLSILNRLEGVKAASLRGYLNHYPHPTVKKFITEINFYSSLRASELFHQGKKTNILEIIFYPFFKFFLNYFLKLGFLDLEPGFIYAFMMSFHSFLVRVKLWQLYQGGNFKKNKDLL